MFEKESKEYANKWLEHIKDLELQHKSDDKPEYIRILEAHQKGAEFGYNKANEWHFVKDGDLPSEEGGWVCNQDGLPCYYDWSTEQWLDCEGTQIRTTEWCNMPHKKEIE